MSRDRLTTGLTARLCSDPHPHFISGVINSIDEGGDISQTIRKMEIKVMLLTLSLQLTHGQSLPDSETAEK